VSTAPPDFSGWNLDYLNAARSHLGQILLVSAGQNDPERPHLRAEYEAMGAEIDRRKNEREAQ
jgi:hypothetical protein